jgi:probable rRNA maturation factor
VRPGVARPLPVSRAELAHRAAAALAVAGAPPRTSLGLILSDDHELAELNRQHMGHDGPTDVLSFPLLPPAAFAPHEGQDPDIHRLGASLPPEQQFRLPPGQRAHLGDVVVSVERAVEQAGEGRGGQTGDVAWSAGDELRLLVVHGTLHICGWDHADVDERDAMRALEGALLNEA